MTDEEGAKLLDRPPPAGDHRVLEARHLHRERPTELCLERLPGGDGLDGLACVVLRAGFGQILRLFPRLVGDDGRQVRPEGAAEATWAEVERHPALGVEA